MKQKRSLTPLVITTFLILFCIFFGWQQVQYGMEGVDHYTRKQTIHLINYLKLGKTLLEIDKLTDLNERLREARETRYIDFYILQRDDQVLFFGNKNDFLEGIHLKYEIFNEILFVKDVAFASTKVGNYVLTIGANLPQGNYWRRFLMDAYKTTALDIAVVGIFIFLVLAYFTRDLLKILSSLRHDRDFTNIATKSRESELLVKGLTAYEHEVSRLKEENQTFGNQVLPALKSEILSGRTPPYDFHCTLVRTDINGFTTQFNGDRREEFLASVNAFFEEVSHVVSRYGGYVYEFIGDEVIFYFKDDEHKDSLAIAISAVRDINSAAKNFRVKSSLAHGQLRFGRQVNGFSLAGSILIETVRILSHVTEKDANSVYFDESCADRLRRLCDMKPEMDVQLKGISGVRRLWSYVQHRPLDEWLANSGDVAMLTYYRSDTDIRRTLDCLAKKVDDWTTERFIKVAGILKEFHVTRSTSGIKKSYLDLLTQLEKKAGKEAGVELAAVCGVCLALISPEHRTADLKAHLQRLMHVSDQRVVASVLEVCETSGPLDFSNNRVLANALIKAGIVDLSEEIVARIQQMLTSTDSGEVASALYVVGELAGYHYRHDPVYLSTRVSFLDLVSQIETFLTDKNDSIRTQAVGAAAKAAAHLGRKQTA
jgi:class 3 adenylate cyclase